MNVAFEAGTAWLFGCARCGSRYVIELQTIENTVDCPERSSAYRFADCCPFCHSREYVRECGAASDDGKAAIELLQKLVAHNAVQPSQVRPVEDFLKGVGAYPRRA
jgi:hypothetical protein